MSICDICISGKFLPNFVILRDSHNKREELDICKNICELESFRTLWNFLPDFFSNVLLWIKSRKFNKKKKHVWELPKEISQWFKKIVASSDFSRSQFASLTHILSSRNIQEASTISSSPFAVLKIVWSF